MYLPGIGQVSPDEVTLAGIGAGGVILTNVLSGMPAFARKSESQPRPKAVAVYSIMVYCDRRLLRYRSLFRCQFTKIGDNKRIEICINH